MTDFGAFPLGGTRPFRRPGGAAGSAGEQCPLDLRPVRVGTGSADEEGRLVFAGDRLVAVLVRLSEQHEALAGQWFLEHGFGELDTLEHPTFPDLDAAREWIACCLGRGR